jgi:hypothetical protein
LDSFLIRTKNHASLRICFFRGILHFCDTTISERLYSLQKSGRRGVKGKKKKRDIRLFFLLVLRQGWKEVELEPR